MGLKKNKLRFFILLFTFWLLLTIDFQIINIIVGLIISFAVTFVTFRIVYDKNHKNVEVPSLLCMVRFTTILIKDIYLSSFSYLTRIIKKDCDPVFIDVYLNTTNPLVITMIANAITLTPGTITVDTDQNKLVVLSIDDPQKKGRDLSEEIREKYEKIFVKKG